MSRRLRHTSLLLLVVLVLSAESCPPNALDCLKLPNNHLILVSKEGKVSLDEAHISKKAQNQVVWMLLSSDKPRRLSIQFTIPPGQVRPFDDMTSLGNDKYEPKYCFQKQPLSFCVSGPINKDAPYQRYDYLQVIKDEDGTTQKDAGIKIEK